MFTVMNFIISNIWIVAGIIILACVAALGALRKTMGLAVKITIVGVIVAMLAIALGFTTSAELKDAVLTWFAEMQNVSFDDYTDAIQQGYTGERFVH